MKAAVALIVFNRPESTRRVLSAIREAKPPVLLIIADGPRLGRAGDREKCAEVRSVLEAGVDWPCEVRWNISEANLGCGRRVLTGLDWVFAQEDAAIILEDDCLPDVSFFPFCEELLARYVHDERIGMVSGSHHRLEERELAASYYACRYGNIWGWATWRRAWRVNDFEMKGWPVWRNSAEFRRLFPDPATRRFWRGVWDGAHAGTVDTWDYQWTYSYLRSGLLGLLPSVGMIENIGYGSDATHTFESFSASMVRRRMRFPLVHPETLVPDADAEREANRRFFNRPSLVRRLARRVAGCFGVAKT